MKLKKFNSIKDLEKEIIAFEKLAKKETDALENYPPHVVYNKILDEYGLSPSSTRNSTTKDKFNSHKIYKTLVNNLNYPKGPETKNSVDTWYKDPLYGRVNEKNVLINHNYWIFVNIAKGQPNPICVFDFVADAFDEMKEIFKSKKPSNNSVYLTDLVAKRGNSSTISAERKYNEYINEKYINFITELEKELKNSKKIKNFDDFSKQFLSYIKNTKSMFSFAGYFDTINIDIYDSYLAFDIFDDANNPSDATRVEFLNDENYLIYEYAARQAGFFVDQNKPWRLVANLKSKPMIAAMRRRYKATELLLETKPAVSVYADPQKYIVEDILENVLREKPEQIFNRPDENPVINLQYLLDFIDYFRKELPFRTNSVKTFKDILSTYIGRYFKIENIDNNKNLTGNLKLADLKLKKSDFIKLSKALIDILLVLQSEKYKVDYIYTSLENQEKILSNINKNFDTLDISDVYASIFTPVSDYAYFTYFPTMMDRFYNDFIDKYPKYNIYGKNSKGNTISFRNDREQLQKEKYKLSNDLLNDFYNFKIIKDYVDLRLFEESKEYTSDERSQIINEVKEIYFEALKEYQSARPFINLRDTSIRIIEAFTGFGYRKLKPIDILSEDKKTPLYSQQIFFDDGVFETRILLERICLTLPDRSDILIEEEICGKFKNSLDIVEEEILEAPPEPEPEEKDPFEEQINAAFLTMNKLADTIGSLNYITNPPGWYRVRKYVEDTLSTELKQEICKRSSTPGKVLNALILLSVKMVVSYSKLDAAGSKDFNTYLSLMLGDEGANPKITKGWFDCKCGAGKLGC